MSNILFTSAGRRVELVQEFIRARHDKRIQGSIICADMNDIAPALYFADKAYTVPSAKDPDYILTLLDICKNERIDLIIPTIDTELETLANNVCVFHDVGTQVLVSSLNTVKTARNKVDTYKFFKEIGLKTPESYGRKREYLSGFPCFIKPLSGSSSVNAFKVNNQKELEFFKYYIGDYIIQDLIEGQEYTVDVFCDFQGNPIYVTPRIRLATRGGEVIKTRISNDEQIIQQVLRIVDDLKPVGPLTVQAIKSNKDGEFYFIEINARFGGGCPLSMIAGADSASAIYDLLADKKLVFLEGAALQEAVFLRFDQNIIIRQNVEGYYERV